MVGLTKPRIIRASVVLPLPLSPAIAVVEGAASGSEKLTLRSATVVRRTPLPNSLVTPRSSISAVTAQPRLAWPPPAGESAAARHAPDRDGRRPAVAGRPHSDQASRRGSGRRRRDS